MSYGTTICLTPTLPMLLQHEVASSCSSFHLPFPRPAPLVALRRSSDEPLRERITPPGQTRGSNVPVQ